MLLVDAHNALNEVNRTAMLKHVRNIWPVGAQFSFNAYHHWKLLALQGSETTLLSKEGVTQGNPLAMIIFEPDVLPATKNCSINWWKQSIKGVKTPYMCSMLMTRLWCPPLKESRNFLKISSR